MARITSYLVVVSLFLLTLSSDVNAKASRRFGSDNSSTLSRRASTANAANAANGLMVEQRDIDAALEILRRANYDWSAHTISHAKRGISNSDYDEGTWTLSGKGYTCKCSTQEEKDDCSAPESDEEGNSNSQESARVQTPSQKASSTPSQTPSNKHHHYHHNHKSSSTSSQHVKHPTHRPTTTAKASTTTTSSAAKTSSTQSKSHHSHCPSGYKYASKGDIMQINKNALVDASDITISLNILNFGSANDSDESNAEKETSNDDETKCKSAKCCYKQSKKQKGSCPSGYKYAAKGDVMQINKNTGVDLSDLTLSLSILNFGNSDDDDKGNATKETSDDESKTCSEAKCCYRTSKKRDGKCPSGYSTARKGDVMQINKNSLVDASDLTLSLHILDFSSNDDDEQKEKTTKADKETCENDTCCYKTTESKGNVTQENENSLVDASGAKASICILSFNCGD